jgi:2'-5' RNA ligase
VLWAGLAPEAPLVALKQAVDAALLPIIGADAEAARGFHPHVTLARWKDGAAADLPEFLAAQRAFAHPAWRVTAFELMQSLLHPSGAQYATERRYDLA